MDELNFWWSKENVLEYFSYFTKLKTGEKETIKFEQEKHPINLLYKIWAESLNEKEIKLGLFEAKNTKALDLYVSIVQLHRTLKDWYEDREIYHYLGILFAHGNIKFYKIWSKWNEVNITREKFISFLKDEMQQFMFGKEPNGEDENTGIEIWLSKIIDYDKEKPTNWKGLNQLQKILLILDVIDHAKERNAGIPLPFLKPKYFKNQKEDEEHIYPSTPQDITEKKFKDLKDPMSSISHYISKLNDGYDENKINWNITTDEWNGFTNEEKNNKLSILKSEIHQKRPINSIGNLVLLHLSINRGFGNDYYADKRISVINNTENGEYVRQHTLKVFVKQIENNDLSNWTMQDIMSNADRIYKTIKEFFSPKY